MIPQFLRANYPLEKHLFLVPKFALTTIGFYPETKRSIWIVIWAAFNFAILTYGCYAELYYGINALSIDLMIAFDAICPVASSIISLFKIFCIWWYRFEFAELIDRVRVLTAAECTSRKIRIKRKLFTIATRLTAMTLFVGICTSTSYSVRLIILNTISYMNEGKWNLETPFKMMLPEVLLSMPAYPITFCLVHWHGYITILGSVGPDGFFFGTCLYLKAILQTLQEDLKDVLGELKAPATANNLDPEQTDKRCAKLLAQIIDRHNEIFELTQKFSKMFVAITLGHFLSSSMVIGMSCIGVLLFSGVGIAVYVLYTCGVVMELFFYCYGGTAVIESSLQVGTTAYSTQWYMRNVAVQKMVLILIARCQKPFLVKIPFFSPSLPVLAAILRFAGSLITLAKSLL